MIIVDTALRDYCKDGRRLKVGLIGAGYSGRLITYQILTAVQGLDVVAIANRTVDNAVDAYRSAGVNAIGEAGAARTSIALSQTKSTLLPTITVA